MVKRKIYNYLFPKLYKINNKATAILKYIITMKAYPNLNNPTLFSEKVTWLMLNDYPNNKSVIVLGDKASFREKLIGTSLETRLVPILGIYDSVEAIDFDKLPQKFVIKISNASGFNAVVDNKENIDKNNLISKLNNWMSTDYGLMAGEKHYSKMKPKLVVENFLEDLQEEYQIFCLNGEYKYIVNIKFGLKDISNAGFSDFKTIENKTDLDTSILFKEEFKQILAPLQPMIKKIPLVRVDIIKADNKFYLGELTFTPSSGLYPSFSYEKNKEWGSQLKL